MVRAVAGAAAGAGARVGAGAGAAAEADAGAAGVFAAPSITYITERFPNTWQMIGMTSWLESGRVIILSANVEPLGNPIVSVSPSSFTARELWSRPPREGCSAVMRLTASAHRRCRSPASAAGGVTGHAAISGWESAAIVMLSCGAEARAGEAGAPCAAGRSAPADAVCEAGAETTCARGADGLACVTAPVTGCAAGAGTAAAGAAAVGAETGPFDAAAAGAAGRGTGADPD